MADPLSIAASVAGLISLGAATLKATHQLVSAIKHAPAQAKLLLDSGESLNTALEQLERYMRGDNVKNLDTNDFRTLETCLERCRAVFEELQRMIVKCGLCPDPSAPVSPAGKTMVLRSMRGFLGRVKWVVRKDDAQDLARKMDSEKSTLTTIMQALNLYVLMVFCTCVTLYEANQ